MRKIFTFLLALTASVGMMNAKVTWNSSNISNLEVYGAYGSYSKEGVTLSTNADMIDAWWSGYGDESHDGISFNAHNTGGYTFSNTLGKNFTKIEMTLTGPGGWDFANLGSGWSFYFDYEKELATVTWTGNASTVDLVKDESDFSGANVKSIVFYFEGDSEAPDPTYTVALKAGTVNADKVTLSATSVVEGATVTVTPNEEYEITAFKATYNTTEEAPSTLDPGTGAYSFTMPAANVTIEATIALKPVPEGDIFAGFTATAGSGGFDNEDYSKLVDGKFISSDWTKWCANDGHKSVPTGESESCWWLDFEASAALSLTGYILTTGNDTGSEHGRNPKNWVLKAKLNADDAWTTIATVDNDATMKNKSFKDYKFFVDKSGSYKYFRFEVFANQGATVMQLCELRLIGSEAPAPTPKYYIAGNMNEWTVNEAYEMTPNNEALTEEYMFTMDLSTTSEFKVVKVVGETQTWYPDGMGNNYGQNGEITADGNYTIYFRPNADGGEGWFYNVIYVAKNPDPGFEAVEIDFRTNPFTLISGAATLVSGTWNDKQHGYYNPVVSTALEAGNYKITVGNCQYGSRTCSVKNEDGSATLDLIDENGQTITSFDTPANCYADDDKVTSAWFVADADQTIRIVCPQYTPYLKVEKVESVPEKVTVYTVTFANAEDATGIVPAAKANLAPNTVITLPKNFSMFKPGATLAAWTDGSNYFAPNTEYTVTDDVTLTAVYSDNTVTLADRKGAVTIKWLFSQSDGVPAINVQGSTTFVVAQAKVAGKTIDVQLPIDATVGKFANSTNSWTQINPGVIFSIPSAEGAVITYKQYDNGDVTTPEINVTASEATYALTAEGTSGKLYYEYIQVVLPAPAPKYYIVGTMNDWEIDEAYELKPNNEALYEEYMFTMDLTTTDQFKVVKETDEDPIYYPDGMGNNYGENGEIKEDGNYTIYFRPDGQGGDDWFYHVIYVAKNGTTAIDQLENGKCENVKMIIDGQLFIIRDGKTYTVTGQQVR